MGLGFSAMGGYKKEAFVYKPERVLTRHQMFYLPAPPELWDDGGWVLSHEAVILGELLIKGNFDGVDGNIPKDGTDVAIGAHREDLPQELKTELLQEAKILKQYNRPKLVGAYTQRQPICIIVDLILRGDFLFFLRME